MTDYLTLDQLTTDEYYGVKVAWLGEYLEQIAAFTHDRRRALAAACALVRAAGERATADVGDPHWCRVTTTCGCGDTCQCPADADGNPEHDCDRYGLPPCETDTYSWMQEKCAADDPNALPIIILDVGAW